MGYFSLDIKKAKGTSDTTQSDHIERKIIPKNADPTRTHLNRVLVEYPDGVHGRDEAIAHRLNTADIRRKITHDQVRVVRVVLSGTHEDMMNIQEKRKARRMVQRQYPMAASHIRQRQCGCRTSAHGREDSAHPRSRCSHRDG